MECEKKQLFVQLSSSQLTEGGANITATISRTGSFANGLPVSISFLHPQRFVFPGTVVIPAGQSGINFSIGVVNNSTLEATLIDTVLTS